MGMQRCSDGDAGRQCHGCSDAVLAPQPHAAGSRGPSGGCSPEAGRHLSRPCHRPAHGVSPNPPAQGQPPCPARRTPAACSAHPCPLLPAEVTTRRGHSPAQDGCRARFGASGVQRQPKALESVCVCDSAVTGDSLESLGHLPEALTPRAPIFWQCGGEEDTSASRLSPLGFKPLVLGPGGVSGLSYKITPGSRTVRWPCGNSQRGTERGLGMERMGWSVTGDGDHPGTQLCIARLRP